MPTQHHHCWAIAERLPAACRCLQKVWLRDTRLVCLIWDAWVKHMPIGNSRTSRISIRVPPRSGYYTFGREGGEEAETGRRTAF